MPRKRLPSNRIYPDHMRCRNGYFSYTNPVDGREFGLGRDLGEAVKEARRMNQILKKSVVPYPEFELSANEIINQAKPIETLCAVYFLVNGLTIQYVGQSTNVHSRIATHLSDAVIPFDRYHLIPCPKRLLLVLEAQYIAALKPRFNKKNSYGLLYPATVRVNGEHPEPSGTNQPIP